MAYLNWQKQGVRLSREAHPKVETQLTLHLSPQQAQLLVQALEGLVQGLERELRLDLPEGWTVFWKLREDTQCRLLLAHPDSEQWVATVSLPKDQMELCVRSLSHLSQGLGLTPLGSLGRVAAGNNFELVLGSQ